MAHPSFTRAKLAHQLRAEGKTMREVGEHLGVQRERARQMINWYEKVLREKAKRR